MQFSSAASEERKPDEEAETRSDRLTDLGLARKKLETYVWRKKKGLSDRHRDRGPKPFLPHMSHVPTVTAVYQLAAGCKVGTYSSVPLIDSLYPIGKIPRPP